MSNSVERIAESLVGKRALLTIVTTGFGRAEVQEWRGRPMNKCARGLANRPRSRRCLQDVRHQIPRGLEPSVSQDARDR